MTIAYACDLMSMCVEFRDEILLRGEECKIRKKFNFFEKWQNCNCYNSTG